MVCSEETERKSLDYQQAATFTYPMYNTCLVWVWTGSS